MQIYEKMEKLYSIQFVFELSNIIAVGQFSVIIEKIRVVHSFCVDDLLKIVYSLNLR